MLGAGVYLSRDYNKAKAYADNGEGAIIKVIVNVGKVIKITY